jgi:hypothetical protein
MSRFEEAVLKVLATILLPTVLGLSLYVNILWKNSQDASPEFNGYVAPQNVYGMIDYVKNSTVSIECGLNKGSGFAFKLLPEVEEDDAIWNFSTNQELQTVILTNHHVVENCTGEKLPLRVQLFSGEILNAELKSLDPDNDLAALAINKEIAPLYAIWYPLDSGYWVMASGSPLDLKGTVTFGNVINIEGTRIYTSASLNRGNSGGPLLDNEGYVIGINTGYRAVAQNINWAIDINALCKKLATCRNNGLLHPIEQED